MCPISVGQACKQGLQVVSSASGGANKGHVKVLGPQLLWRIQDPFWCMLDTSDGRRLGSVNRSLPPCSFRTFPHGLPSMLFHVILTPYLVDYNSKNKYLNRPKVVAASVSRPASRRWSSITSVLFYVLELAQSPSEFQGLNFISWWVDAQRICDHI